MAKQAEDGRKARSGRVASRRREVLAKPDWLKIKTRGGDDYNEMKALLRTAQLNTICESGNCPNRGECFAHRTATFMVLGDHCTRNCTFCNVETGRGEAPDPGEPLRLAETVRHLGLKFAVITSVTRDELPDGGGAHFAAVIREVNRLNPDCGVELLIPDFLGDPLALNKVLVAGPDVLAHNVETVPRLYPEVRPQAVYQRSLTLLKSVRQWADARGIAMRVKTGIMLGLGEEKDEIVDLMRDCVDHGVDILTIGQYLQPTPRHHPVERYVGPEEFDELAETGRGMGLRWVESGPLVRSSYHAREQAEGHDQAVALDSA